ncbi:MAG: anti-sigma factor [Actinomycetota bacterium]|nr:anti-sigma factor [Actinomycetota bacterium]MDQ2981028.1 anti-sigma factor [Actinomycetota bacterium]
MSDKPDFRELVGDDLPDEERTRLERVHELLVAAGPPPELPPALVEPDLDPRDANVEFLPRRRAGFVLGIAAAVGIAAFLGGFLAGHAKEPFTKVFDVQMQGTAQAASASATIKVGKVDEAGNWPLKLVVRGLKPLPKGQYYEMFLTHGHKAAATCGTFRVTQSGDSIRLNAPYNLRRFDGWVVTLERPGSRTHPVVLTT